MFCFFIIAALSNAELLPTIYQARGFKKGDVVEKKQYKVMAYILSTGLWDAFGPISLDKVLGQEDPLLANALKQWQDSYDDQFKAYPYAFDWKQFNEAGETIADRIRARLPDDAEICYEPSDDREFFLPEDCRSGELAADVNIRECDLRARKRSMLHTPVS